MSESNGTEVEVKDVEKVVEVEVKNDKATEKEGEGATKNQVAKENGSGDPPSVLEKQLIRQIEYYFGDINLPRDKYLLEQVKSDKEGWVPLEIMFKFKRLANLSTDTDVVIGALAKSPENLIEVSEDRTKIRRSPNKPLPIYNEERRKELSIRTLYIKGFPLKDITLDDVLEFFSTFEPLENVQMRTYKDRTTQAHSFKGSVFALFRTVEGAKKFMELDEVKYKDVALIRKWQ